MRITIEQFYDNLLGKCFAISTEYHDGIVYRANSIKEAVKKYEADRGVRVTQISEWGNIKEV